MRSDPLGHQFCNGVPLASIFCCQNGDVRDRRRGLNVSIGSALEFLHCQRFLGRLTHRLALHYFDPLVRRLDFG